MKNIKIIKTDDGSHSLFLPELNETYHSFHGAINESEHIFIQKGLEFAFEKIDSRPIKILEIGFGTGLNALTTLKNIKTHPKESILYDSVEAYPLEAEIYQELNYVDLLGDEGLKVPFALMHESEWNKEVKIKDNFSLCKIHGKIEDLKLKEKHYDLVYFDAFAPSKQAEMWSLDILEKIKNSLSPNAILVTYCAKGQFKRDLKSLGFTVETLDGPPGKKEMVRGILT